MPHPIVEVNSYDASITVPDDGDPRTAASVGTAFQSLANRTKYLQQLGEALGIKRLRMVTSYGALAAIAPTDRADGDIVLVTSAGLPFGIYMFVAADSTTPATLSPQSLLIVAPSTGGGRWWHAPLSTFMTAVGDAGRWKIPVPNAIGPTITVALLAGDYVHLDARFGFDPSSGSAVGQWEAKLGVTTGPSITNLVLPVSFHYLPVGGLPEVRSTSCRFSAGADGSYTFSLFSKCTLHTSGTMFSMLPWLIRAQVVRP